MMLWKITYYQNSLLFLMLCVFTAAVLVFVVLYGRFVWRTLGALVRPIHQTDRLAYQYRIPLLHHYDSTAYFLKLVGLTGAIAALAIGLLQPYWEKAPVVTPQKGRDLLIALDVSPSMCAEDYKPSRLSCAKKGIEQLVRSRIADRVGLIVFAGEAVLISPLTTDYNAFFMFLDCVDIDTISSSSTALDKAVHVARQTYERISEKKHKMLAIFTDGEDFSERTNHLLDEAQRQGIRIATVGIGTPEGAPIPRFDKSLHNGSYNRIGVLKDTTGAIVISRLNEPLLQQLARQSNGRYIRLSSSIHERTDTALSDIYTWVQEADKEQFDEKNVPAHEDAYYICAGISFVLFLISWLI